MIWIVYAVWTHHFFNEYTMHILGKDLLIGPEQDVNASTLYSSQVKGVCPSRQVLECRIWNLSFGLNV
jgi:hypothetical protein